MQISINVNPNDTGDFRQTLCSRLRHLICYMSIWNCFTLLLIFIIFTLLLYFCKVYTNTTLLWLERQDSAVIYIVIVVFFIIVSFPVTVGYIVIVIASGYLFGARIGLVLSVAGANIGLTIAHNVLKVFEQHSSIKSYMTSETATAIFKVISGPACFKIVFCARLTPIPFGLQNTIFAVSMGDT